MSFWIPRGLAQGLVPGNTHCACDEWMQRLRETPGQNNKASKDDWKDQRCPNTVSLALLFYTHIAGPGQNQYNIVKLKNKKKKKKGESPCVWEVLLPPAAPLQSDGAAPCIVPTTTQNLFNNCGFLWGVVIVTLDRSNHQHPPDQEKARKSQENICFID